MRVYLHPVAFARAADAVQGRAIRLGGSPIWTTALRVDCRDGDRLAYSEIIAADSLKDILSSLPEAAQAEVQRQYDNLRKNQAPLSLSGMTLRFDQPQIMGIINATPDSFSDGGVYGDASGAADAGLAMVEAGASLIDIGGESTRPGAYPVSEAEEIARTVLVVERLARSGAIISIDTRKAAVMQTALKAGTAIVNDVSALLHDPESLDVVKTAGCPVVLMHAPSPGDDLHDNPQGYGDVVQEVFDWLAARIEAVVAAGVRRDNIIIDPGIGFGKTLEDNLKLLNALPLFHALGQPLLIGASRKRMIAALSKDEPAHQRLPGSLALALHSLNMGAHILRVHDVAETMQAMRVWHALHDA